MLSSNLQFIELCCAPAQVAHVTGEVQFPKTKDGQVGMGWAAGQVATTADFSHGSWFWTHFSGGLNYQVSSRLPDYSVPPGAGTDHPLGMLPCQVM